MLPQLVPRPPPEEHRTPPRRRRGHATARLYADARRTQRADSSARRPKRHTARATTRNFGRVPSYLPRVGAEVLRFAQSTHATAPAAPAARHEPPEEARASEVSATSAEDPRAGRQSKREQEKEKRQVKRDRRAVREAFSVIDDDGGGSVEAPEVLKALRALGKQVDDKSFWTKFQKMCGDGPMFLDREKFETMMLELLARKRQAEAQRSSQGSALPGLKPTMSKVHYSNRRAIHDLPSQHKSMLKRRLRKNRDVKEAGDVHDNVRKNRDPAPPTDNMAEGPRKPKDGSKATESELQPKRQGKATPADDARPQRRGRQAGSEWMDEALLQYNNLAETYKALTTLRDLQVEAHITEPPFDPRLRTRAGRALVAEERQALAQGEEVGDGKETSEEAAGMAVIDVFAELFT